MSGTEKSDFTVRRSELGSGWYTAGELAKMRLPGYTITSRAMRDRLESEGWDYRMVVGRGPRGAERVYRPPPHVLALIDAPHTHMAEPDAGYRAPPIDHDQLRMAITLAEDADLAAGKALTPEQKADLILTYYQRLHSGWRADET